jgi:hypothetical protein
MWPASACWRARSFRRLPPVCRVEAAADSPLPQAGGAPPLNIGLPSWEYDPTFDIRNHVREVTLKHGSDTELKALAGKILSTVMDRQHPLWDLTWCMD